MNEDTQGHEEQGEKPVLERPRTLRMIVAGVAIVCVLLAVSELFIHRHGHFDFENIPVFEGVFGFLAYSFIVFSAKALRPLLKRKEDYYGE